MKIVCAIIRPFKLEDVKKVVETMEVQGMTVMEVKGYVRQKGHSEIYQGSELAVDLLPKLLVMVVTPDRNVEQVQKAVRDSAITDNYGDGIIWCMPLDMIMRVRTGKMITDENFGQTD